MHATNGTEVLRLQAPDLRRSSAAGVGARWLFPQSDCAALPSVCVRSALQLDLFLALAPVGFGRVFHRRRACSGTRRTKTRGTRLGGSVDSDPSGVSHPLGPL